MQADLTLVQNHNVTITLYPNDEEKASITKMVVDGASVEDASFIVLKNRLRRDIGEGAPQFFPTPAVKEGE